MTIPIASTTISILRAPEQDDGYPDTEPVYVTVTTGVSAHLSRPHGNESDLGERTMLRVRLICNPCDLRHTDLVRDEQTGLVWQVDWVQLRTQGTITDHLVAGLHREDVELQATVPDTA